VPSASRHTRIVPSKPPLMVTGMQSGSAPAAKAYTGPGVAVELALRGRILQNLLSLSTHSWHNDNQIFSIRSVRRGPRSPPKFSATTGTTRAGSVQAAPWS
jgi:hypothetical protein